MDMNGDRGNPRETPKAAEAFADYVALGPRRSLRLLAEHYAATGRYSSVTTALSTVRGWSSTHRWQDRIAQAITDRTLVMFAEAAELDAETLLATSRDIHRRIADGGIESMSLDEICSVRQQVRAVAGRVASVAVSVSLMRDAEELAGRLGIPPARLLRDAEAVARRAWDQLS